MKKQLIGKQIKKLRSRDNVSQEELAQRLGVSQTHLSLLEKDCGRYPSIKLLHKICDEFDCEVILETREYIDIFNDIKSYLNGKKLNKKK